MLLECLQQQNRTEESKQLIQNHSEELIAQAERAYIDGDQHNAAIGWGASAFMDLQDPAALSQSSDGLEVLISAYLRNPEMSRPIPVKDLPEKIRELARRSYVNENPQDAIRYWQAASLMGMNDPALYKNLGTVQYEAGNSEDAERTWKEEISQNPKAVDLKFNLANRLGEIGRTEEAESLFRQAIETAPGSAKLYLQYGRLLLSQGKPERASAVYRQGLSRSPGDDSLNLALSEISSQN